MDMSGGNSMNMRPIFGGYPFQGNFIDLYADGGDYICIKRWFSL